MKYRVVLAYLDIEIYPQQEEPSFKDKIIAIGYVEVDGKSELLKEWDSNERTILSQFYEYLKEKLRTERTVMMIGFNLLLFDRDFLAVRLQFHAIDTLENVFNNFKRIYWRDLRQHLLPFNKYSFKGLSEEEVAKKFKIEPPTYSNKEIKTFYKKGEYEKIEEHAKSEMRFLSNLAWKMRNVREIIKAFSVVV